MAVKKKSGPKQPGYDSKAWGFRPVDKWREWAAVPLPAIKVSSSRRPDDHVGRYDPTYTLEEDGKVIGTWRDSDVPWLYLYLGQRLGQLHGAWHLAQPQLTTVRELSNAGKKTAVSAEKAAEDQLAKDIVEANKLLKQRPSMSVLEIAGKMARGRNVDHLRRKFEKRDGKIVAKVKKKS